MSAIEYETAKKHIFDMLTRCSLDELRVVEVILLRFTRGRKKYGALDLSKDKRDWRAERAAEYADAIFYEACEVIAATAPPSTPAKSGRDPRVPTFNVHYDAVPHGNCPDPRRCNCDCGGCARDYTIWKKTWRKK